MLPEMSRKTEMERRVTELFSQLEPAVRSADGRRQRDRPDWLARIGPTLWGIELTAFRNGRDPAPKQSDRPDEASIEARIRAKAARIEDYRASGAERIGLLIHAEFGPGSCRIEDEAQARRLLDRAGSVHEDVGRPFDAIWLIRNQRPEDRGRLWRVQTDGSQS